MTSDAQAITEDEEGAAAGELETVSEGDLDVDEEVGTREEDAGDEALLDTREIETEEEADDDTAKEEEVAFRVAEVENEEEAMADRETDSEDDEEIELADEVDDRDEDGPTDEEGVLMTPLRFRGMARSPSPVVR